ncbi:MAG: hypothetical protein AAGA77_17145 [Bacteroidota bacterium]
MIERVQFDILNIEADQKEKILISLKKQKGSCHLIHESILGSGEFVKSDFFECLKALRYFLEKFNFLICCFGCRLDVYPSQLSRQMSGGIKAYILKLGEPASREDLINIFWPNSEEKISTIEEQEEYYKKWINSLN